MGNLSNIRLIEAYIQLIMRIYLNMHNIDKIDSNSRLSKYNFSSRKNYSIKTALLEKYLLHNNSKYNKNKQIIH